MPLDGLQRDQSRTSPMQIAHNPLFTAREKIEMLNKLKGEVTGEDANPDNLGFDPAEIDEAIQQIKLEVQDGVRPEPSVAEVANGLFR